MYISSLGRILWEGPGSRLRSHSAKPGGRKLRLEWLEARELLSVSGPGFAVPYLVAYKNAGGVMPLTASPAGSTRAQVRRAYGFDKLTLSGGAAADGAGTTIAIVDAFDDPNIANDLRQFDLAFGLPDPVLSKVSQTGSTVNLPTTDPGWITEIALDVEWAHAIAPKANILLVEANDNSYGNLLAGVDYARNAPGVVAVSMSWGGSEFSGEQALDGHFTTPSGHGGVTFLAASGDAGAPAGYPGTSPKVISVGGTTLNTNAAGNYLSESGWSGSGGGISAFEPQPAYQRGVALQSPKFRTNPDVAYDANPSTGFPVYDSFDNPLSSPWGQWGGTSDAAPQWAALIAIADQGRALVGEAPLDGPTQTLPMLYALPGNDFHDITTGGSTGQPPYSAGKGYDLVTGRGTPVANLLVNGLTGVGATNSATHFSIRVPRAIRAGARFSITVRALNRSNQLAADYQGTVHFGSSDRRAVARRLLPADYTFTAADHGVHTFTGVRLVTRGRQRIVVTDTADSSIAARALVSVRRAATRHHTSVGHRALAAAIRESAGGGVPVSADAVTNPADNQLRMVSTPQPAAAANLYVPLASAVGDRAAGDRTVDGSITAADPRHSSRPKRHRWANLLDARAVDRFFALGSE